MNWFLSLFSPFTLLAVGIFTPLFHIRSRLPFRLLISTSSGTLYNEALYPFSAFTMYSKHGECTEWVEGLKSEAMTLLTSTNNRVESMNQKLKAVIARYSSIVQFFKSLMCVIQSMRIETDHRALLDSQKVSLTTYGEDSLEHKYLDMLTPYAFHFIKGQLETRDSIEAQVMMIFKRQQPLAAENFGQLWDCPAGISSLCVHPKAFCCASPIWWHSTGQEATTSGATESTRQRSELTLPPGS